MEINYGKNVDHTKVIVFTFEVNNMTVYNVYLPNCIFLRLILK